ncbi:MAG TPA: SpoIID/LytB domain-containing protein [Humisphaera sp.]
MAAARRRRSVAVILFRSYRLVIAVAAIAVLGALTVHLGCGKTAPPASPAAVPRQSLLVRVRVLQDVQQVKLTATDKLRQVVARSADGKATPLTLPPRTPVVVAGTADGWQIGSLVVAGTGPLVLEPDPPAALGVEGRVYRGSFRLVRPRAGQAFDVVNHVTVDEYLKGVLSAELHAEFGPEAYKAQAVIARTYALYTVRTTPDAQHFDLHADVRSQMYGGVRSETVKAVQAADATAGQVVAFGPPGQEKIFKTYYSSCCGGATISNQDVFGEPLTEPFTPRVVGPRCDISSGPYKARFNWGPIVVSRTDLAKRMAAWGKVKGQPIAKLQSIKRLAVQQANAAGRPVQFVVEDVRGNSYVLSAEHLRLAVNYDAPETSKLPSAFVTPVVDGPNVRFTNGHGFGHGVGMCQWCLEAQARQGVKYEAMVRDAYPGAIVLKAY